MPQTLSHTSHSPANLKQPFSWGSTGRRRVALRLGRRSFWRTLLAIPRLDYILDTGVALRASESGGGAGHWPRGRSVGRPGRLSRCVSVAGIRIIVGIVAGVEAGSGPRVVGGIAITGIRTGVVRGITSTIVGGGIVCPSVAITPRVGIIADR